MHPENPQAIYRKDYHQPDFFIESIDLHFSLDEDVTLVHSQMVIRPRTTNQTVPLVLQGESLVLKNLKLNGQVLNTHDYQVDKIHLTIPTVPTQSFTLETIVEIKPQENTALTGLYKSSGNYCTQCEAEGFRRITYFLDRPDVMARYTTTIVADKNRYPVLLSNGNRVEYGELTDGRHWVKWADPFPKPSYLFALVAGNLHCHGGKFVTRSGREVRLEIWVEPQNHDQCEHALQSLAKAMRWDEERFGLEYDLDIYMIVAVSDFNMGAMENKGLNVFNAKFVLCRPDTATDDDYENIEAVIAHEYFHNWTGNRVTCRDWFQLTLKEGLTVFRDQSFTEEMTSAAVKRIQDVRILRTSQFAEDQSPMAHPIRPESYIEMNNFYTVTVYNKGAEVIRLYQTLLGKDGFRRGMDLYFQRHDGQAVTCDDFRAAMADANKMDLSQFERWYDQAGTPVVDVLGTYNALEKTYSLTLRQQIPANLQAWHIPIAVGLLGKNGQDLPLQLATETNSNRTCIIELREVEQTVTFVNIPEAPIPSLLRHFSAPIKLNFSRQREELAFLMAHDSDPFNRWEAGQQLAQQVIFDLLADWQADKPLQLDPLFSNAVLKILQDTQLEGSIKALMLTLPTEGFLGQQQAEVAVEGLFTVRQFVLQQLAQDHYTQWLTIYKANHHTPYSNEASAIACRRLKNVALHYLCRLDTAETTALAEQQFTQSDNMTDQQSALSCLVNTTGTAKTIALTRFYTQWKENPLVLDKWFSVQAMSYLPDTFENVQALLQHSDFNLKNPNRARSLLAVFSQNQAQFHRADGLAYQLQADIVLQLNTLNPQIASRFVSVFNHWRRFDPARQALMQTQLTRIIQHPDLSKDVYEVVSKSLNAQN
ncbi:aminopeptidase N [Beggiatoa leptomitoformis]|uniref:Aminopeptidase N n=1 Tax=Beggiatoa leptomitoformis TaxID=288004 RepID=A0A2N9YDA8_9GAMM|nr:aminopeptidase N [Beggiatoa leptomitoformis]ALG69119.1 aminopeptidase N [Beggiatoa leptomitoformis]AUI68467.1 aminopeptidase N [Beggiatoa leptomitoformis]